MPEEKDHSKKDLLLIAVGVSWEYAMGLISNRYAAQIPLLYFSLLLALPVVLTLAWIIRMEQQEGRIRALLARHTVSTILVLILAIFAGWSSFTKYEAKLRASASITDKSTSNLNQPSSSPVADKSIPISPSASISTQPKIKMVMQAKSTVNNNKQSRDHNQQQKAEAGVGSSLVQNNSGGVNVQQGTTGSNSPIVNSPISIGDVTKTISKEQSKSLASYLLQCPNKGKIEILGDQYSARGEFLDELYSLFSDAGWRMMETRPNIRMIAGPSAKQLSAVSVSEYGEPVIPGERVRVDSSEPAFCVLIALQKLGLTPSINRTKANPVSFAPLSATDEVYIFISGSVLDGK
jgi:hypothetical protein